MKKTRILHLIVEYHPVFSGHGIYLRTLFQLFDKEKFNTAVLTCNFANHPKEDEDNGVKISRITFDPKKYWDIKLSIKTILFLIKNIYKFDILHIHGHADVFGLLTILCKIFRKKMIMQMVLMGADDPISIINSSRFMRYRFPILRKIDKFIYISRPIGDACLKVGIPNAKLAYIPQGVDLQKFHPANLFEKRDLRNELNIPTDSKVVVFVGSIINRKGVDILIDAWPFIQSRCRDALLLLVGPYRFGDADENESILNAYVTDIMNTISADNLNIHLVGRSDSVEKYLRTADVFVLPSRKEGFGNVILEAMACGVPPVISYMDGVSAETVVDGDTGFIAHNSVQISEYITELLINSALASRIGASARTSVEQKFDLKIIARRYDSCYDELAPTK